MYKNKNDYSVIIALSNGDFKKYTFVHNLYNFSNFVNRQFPGWSALNVYNRRTGKFLIQYHPGDFIPPKPKFY